MLLNNAEPPTLKQVAPGVTMEPRRPFSFHAAESVESPNLDLTATPRALNLNMNPNPNLNLNLNLNVDLNLKPNH